MNTRGNQIRSLLAMTGADLSGIDKSFKANEQGDYSGNRLRANSQLIENADYQIRQRMGMIPVSQPAQQPTMAMQYPIYQEQPFNPVMNFQPVISKPSREERLNKLLGKTQVQQVPVQQVHSDDYMMIRDAVKEALEPVVEHLEDIAILNGILVQRLEKLIKTVDPSASFDENDVKSSEETSSFQGNLPEMEQQMEIYDPEVSMSLTDDEEEPVEVPTKKKRKTK